MSRLIREIPDPIERRQAAKVFLELFRLLHYLEYAEAGRVDDDSLKSTVLIFALITSEARLLLGYLERRVLNEAIAALPPQFREVLVLRELEDLSYRDIARIAGAPIGTVMSRLSRARRLLAESLRVIVTASEPGVSR